jgi:hypothetical protein
MLRLDLLSKKLVIKKNINMKQLLFLLLFPCLCVAQYPGNGNQKITLGEQTSADGLVYRGNAAADTTRKPSVDTMAFILLDTNTNIIWQYKKATNNAWTRVGGSISSGVTGVLPVANGGTNTSTLTANSILYASSSSQVATSSNLNFNTSGLQIGNDNEEYNNIQILNKNATPNTNRRGGIAVRTFENDSLVAIVSTFSASSARVLTFGGGVTNLKNPTGIRFMTSLNTVDPNSRGSLTRMQIDSIGNIGINTTSPSERLHVVGNVRISGLAATGTRTVLADVNGVLSAPVSSINYKENVKPLNYGLNEILQINPVSFDYIDKDKWGEERKLGFIVEDIFPIFPEVTGTMNDGDLYLDMVKLIPILTKAIQEQQALIKALEQRILTLENK